MDPQKLRRSKRYPFRKRVRFGTKTPEHIGHTLNLSKYGLLIEASKLFNPGTHLVVEILDKLTYATQPNSPVTFVAKVRWATRGINNVGKMGIEFLTHSKEIEREFEKHGN